MAIENGSTLASVFTPGVVAVIAGLFVLILILTIIIYIYMSFAFMAIAKRAKLPNPGLAWIPGVGPLILAFQAAKAHWWPWLLIIGFFVPYINIICVILFVVYTTMWNWKLFEKVGRPGWWAILSLISIVQLVLIGIAAWGNNKK